MIKQYNFIDHLAQPWQTPF